jgi:hypothetical protein
MVIVEAFWTGFGRLKICEGLHRIMDLETVYKLWRSIIFRKQSSRILLTEADFCTNQAGILRDFDERGCGRGFRIFFVFFLWVNVWTLQMIAIKGVLNSDYKRDLLMWYNKIRDLCSLIMLVIYSECWIVRHLYQAVWSENVCGAQHSQYLMTSSLAYGYEY